MDIKLSDRISETLEERVVTGTLGDGERLDEIKLAEQFGVSRTPVREALQKLVFTGLAKQIPRRGVFVSQPGPVELLEMFETMAELEAVCGRLAAGRISDAALAELREANRRCEDAVVQEDAGRYYSENEVFHRVIYRAAGNRFLEKQTLQLQSRLKPFRRMQLKMRGRMGQSMAEHRDIVQALVNGDAAGAELALRAHVAVQGERFHQMLANLKGYS